MLLGVTPPTEDSFQLEPKVVETTFSLKAFSLST